MCAPCTGASRQRSCSASRMPSCRLPPSRAQPWTWSTSRSGVAIALLGQLIDFLRAYQSPMHNAVLLGQALLGLHEKDAWLAGRLFAAMSDAGSSGITLERLVMTLASCVKVGRWPLVIFWSGMAPANACI